MAVLRDRTFGSPAALRRWVPCTRPRRPFAGPRTSGSVARADRSECASAGRPARCSARHRPSSWCSPTRAGRAADDLLCDALCAGLGALVLHVFWGEALERAAGALDWAADHAAELDGDPRRVLVAGRDRAAVAASALALRATDDGWPPLVGQVLVIWRTGVPRGDAGLSRSPAATIVTPVGGCRSRSACARRRPGHGARRPPRRPERVPRAAVPARADRSRCGSL